jgi:hypothetical protein
VKALGEFFTWYSKTYTTESKPEKTVKKRKRDPDAPKAPLSSYMLFCRDMREELKSEKPELDAKQMVSELGKRWREISQDEREVTMH